MPHKKPCPIAFVPSRGEGKRLLSLTAQRYTPSVPFSGKQLIVDFVLRYLFRARGCNTPACAAMCRSKMKRSWTMRSSWTAAWSAAG